MNAKHQIDLKQVNQKNLVKSSVLSDNNCTTKHITAKPSRHSMAFFVPSILQSTGSKLNHFSINALLGDLWRNDGLITQNTIALWVNMRSRLCAVVETHHHYLHGDKLLTKHIGA